MSEIKNVEKNGLNQNQNYKFAKETDFVDKVKPLLGKYRLVMLPKIVSNTVTQYGDPTKPSFLTVVEMEYTLIDIDSKDREVIKVSGQGSDRGDKGIYKAMTGAKKYAYSVTFHISTGDDPETTENEKKQKAAPKVVVKKPASSKDTELF